MRILVLDNGAVVTEMTKEEQGETIYEYYFQDRFVFGVTEQFSIEHLQNLYDNGYFD